MSEKAQASASDPQSSEDPAETEDGISPEMKELANSIENQIGQLEDLEADSDGAPEESESFDDALANQEELSQAGQDSKNEDVQKALEKAGEKLAEGDLEAAKDEYKKAMTLTLKPNEQRGTGETDPTKESRQGDKAGKQGGSAQSTQMASSKNKIKLLEQQEGNGQSSESGEKDLAQKDQDGEGNASSASMTAGKGEKPGQGGKGGKPGKSETGGGSEAMENEFKTASYEKKKAWEKEFESFEGQKMQGKLEQAPQQYRQLVKQYYEAIARQK